MLSMKGSILMGQIIPRLSDTIDTIPDYLPRRERKELARDVAREHGQGLVRAARVNAMAHVARTGLLNTALLSRDEEMFIAMAPLGEARFKAICDAYAIYAAGEVGRL